MRFQSFFMLMTRIEDFLKKAADHCFLLGSVGGIASFERASDFLSTA
jgi:hypothetical protein